MKKQTVILCIILLWSILRPGPESVAWASAESISIRSVLPDWVDSEVALRHYIDRKYFGPAEGCDPLKDGGWFCHISCGGECRIESFFDLKSKREISLPQTEANYFFLPIWRMIVSVAFLPVQGHWQLSLVSLRLSDLMIFDLPIAVLPHQRIRSLKIDPVGSKVGFDIRYCLDDSCWRDSFRIKRNRLRLRTHRQLEGGVLPVTVEP